MKPQKAIKPQFPPKTHNIKKEPQSITGKSLPNNENEFENFAIIKLILFDFLSLLPFLIRFQSDSMFISLIFT